MAMDKGGAERWQDQPVEVEGLPVQLQPQWGGTLSDFALGLSVEHSVCTLSVDGHNDVARPEIGCLGLAPLCYLEG